ncbi:MAG TPA: serine hydrolase [Dongiaceae bacterium]|nr:serine hydrolase [Dongiaceae bacterium]
MLFPVSRRGGALLLVALLAAPTRMVEAATAAPASTQGHSSHAAKHKATHKSRHARRPPPGGVYARNAIVLDPATGQVLYEKNSSSTVPIASLTKLMTAMVFLEQNPDLTRSVEVTRTELTGGGHTRLRNKEHVALGDLLHMSLMCSDNVATRVLARESGLSSDAFVSRMNQKAAELGLGGSRFVEPTGLDERNVSTAADVARMLKAAADIELFRQISTSRSYEFWSDRGLHRVANTDRLLYNRQIQVLGGKTGFINEAGYCLATWIRTEGRDMIAVVLGAPTNATRFADCVRLVQKTLSMSIVPTQP